MEGPYEKRGDATIPLLFLDPIVCFSEVSVLERRRGDGLLFPT